MSKKRPKVSSKPRTGTSGRSVLGMVLSARVDAANPATIFDIQDSRPPKRIVRVRRED